MMRGDPGPWVSPDLALVAYLLHSQDQVEGRVSSLASSTTWSLAPPPARQVTPDTSALVVAVLSSDANDLLRDCKNRL